MNTKLGTGEEQLERKVEVRPDPVEPVPQATNTHRVSQNFSQNLGK